MPIHHPPTPEVDGFEGEQTPFLVFFPIDQPQALVVYRFVDVVFRLFVLAEDTIPNLGNYLVSPCGKVNPLPRSAMVVRLRR